MGGVMGMAKMAGDAIGKAAKTGGLNPMKTMGGNMLNAGKNMLKGDTAGQKVGSALSGAASLLTGGAISQDGFIAAAKGLNQVRRNAKAASLKKERKAMGR